MEQEQQQEQHQEQPQTFENFCETFNYFTFNKNVMKLNIFVDSDDKELIQLYKKSAFEHNKKILNDPHFYDSGFDLFLPKNSNHEKGITEFKATGWNADYPSNKVDFKVRCCAKKIGRAHV